MGLHFELVGYLVTWWQNSFGIEEEFHDSVYIHEEIHDVVFTGLTYVWLLGSNFNHDLGAIFFISGKSAVITFIQNLSNIG